MLEVHNLSKSYGSQVAVRDVSFSVAKGEIVGFLGPNGAGKSTVMKLVSGCLPMDTGSVRIAGIDLQQEPLKAKAQLGLLLENNPLYDEMYVSEYLEYVAGLYSDANVKEAVQKVFCHCGLDPQSPDNQPVFFRRSCVKRGMTGFLDSLLQTELRKKIGQLSKGYRQRVGLAQAIIHQPAILLLDEPASGLDPNQMETFRRLLLEWSSEAGILFSSHSLQETATICTRILFIHRGKIVADMPAGEIDNLEQLFKELTQ